MAKKINKTEIYEEIPVEIKDEVSETNIVADEGGKHILPRKNPDIGRIPGSDGVHVPGSEKPIYQPAEKDPTTLPNFGELPKINPDPGFSIGEGIKPGMSLPDEGFSIGGDNKKDPRNIEIGEDGTVRLPNGIVISPEGSVGMPNGTVISPDGQIIPAPEPTPVPVFPGKPDLTGRPSWEYAGGSTEGAHQMPYQIHATENPNELPIRKIGIEGKPGLGNLQRKQLTPVEDGKNGIKDIIGGISVGTDGLGGAKTLPNAIERSKDPTTAPAYHELPNIELPKGTIGPEDVKSAVTEYKDAPKEIVPTDKPDNLRKVHQVENAFGDIAGKSAQTMENKIDINQPGQ